MPTKMKSWLCLCYRTPKDEELTIYIIYAYAKRQMGTINKMIQSPPLPLATRLKLLVIHHQDLNRHLYNLVHFKTSAPATRHINTTHVSTSDITIDPSRNLWLRLFVPLPDSHTSLSLPLPLPLPFIIYFHGGGFTHYAPDTTFYDHLCTHLAAAVPAVIASVNYRLTPDYRYPCQYEDGFDVLKFIDARYSDILPPNTDVSKCIIGGDSAGGNIAHHVIIRALEKKPDKLDKIKIIGVLGLQPFFGGEERTEAEMRLTKAPVINVKKADVYWRDFLPEGADRNHPAANAETQIQSVVKNLDFPTTLVVVGGYDPLQDWQRRYVECLKSCGKRVLLLHYPNAFHGFYAFPELPEFASLIRDVANFVREQVNSN